MEIIPQNLKYWKVWKNYLIFHMWWKFMMIIHWNTGCLRTGTDRCKNGCGMYSGHGPGSYPYINAKQITGLVGGLKGASEYENLVGFRGFASKGMDSQSVIHVFIVFLMVLGNIAYLITRKKTKKG